MLAPVLAYYIRDWQGLTWSYVALGLPGLLWILVPESPIWLLKNGRDREALQIFEKIARKNGKRNFTLRNRFDVYTTSTSSSELNTDTCKKRRISPLILFQTDPAITILTIKTSILWMATSLTYFGLSLTPGNLPGSVYLNAIIYGFIDLVSIALCMKLVDRPKFGRKLPMLIGFATCGLAMLASVALSEWENLNSIDSELPDSNVDTNCAPKEGREMPTIVTETAIRLLYFTGKFCVAGIFACIYQYSGELFPAEIRATGLAFGCCVGKFVTIFTTQVNSLAHFYNWLPAVIYASICLTASAITFTLPETAGRTVENLEDCKLLLKNVQPGKLSKNTR